MPSPYRPNFCIPLPKNGNYNSIIRLADEYKLKCEVFEDKDGIIKVDLWDKYTDFQEFRLNIKYEELKLNRKL